MTLNIKQKMLLYRINFTKLNILFEFNWKQYPVLCLFSLSIIFSFPLSPSVSELLFSVFLSLRVSVCFLFHSCFFPLFATNCFPHILTILFQNISHLRCSQFAWAAYYYERTIHRDNIWDFSVKVEKWRNKTKSVFRQKV